MSINIKWEPNGNRTPDGEPISGIRHGLLNFIAIKINEKDGAVILKIVLSHNNYYTSTFTQKDRIKVINKNNTSFDN